MSNYFDYAAATPLDSEVLAAMTPYFTENFYNPSAQYKAAAAVKKAHDESRAAVAVVLGARPTEIIFTAGGSEANNLAIYGVMSQFPGANCVTSAVEHESVLEPASRFERRLAVVLPDGRLDCKALENLIDDNTALVSIMYANNEIGTVQPLSSVATIVDGVRQDRRRRGIDRPIYFHTDACQAANYLSLQTSRLGVDLMTLNAGKMYGPKQSAVLYVKHGILLQPLVLGGGQENGLRSGTENVANHIGFAVALQKTSAMRESESHRLMQLRDKLIAKLLQDISGLTINGSQKHRLPNNIHISISGQDNERLLYALDEQGIMVATGSACSASSDDPSHVLTALGLSSQETASSLRISLGRQTTAQSIEDLAAALKKLT